MFGARAEQKYLLKLKAPRLYQVYRGCVGAGYHTLTYNRFSHGSSNNSDVFWAWHDDDIVCFIHLFACWCLFRDFYISSKEKSWFCFIDRKAYMCSIKIYYFHTKVHHKMTEQNMTHSTKTISAFLYILLYLRITLRQKLIQMDVICRLTQ